MDADDWCSQTVKRDITYLLHMILPNPKLVLELYTTKTNLNQTCVKYQYYLKSSEHLKELRYIYYTILII